MATRMWSREVTGIGRSRGAAARGTASTPACLRKRVGGGGRGRGARRQKGVRSACGAIYNAPHAREGYASARSSHDRRQGAGGAMKDTLRAGIAVIKRLE